MAQLKPLWLDEQYSLFYAGNLNNLAIFTESHLPTYYYLLSFLQQITTGILELRTISSILPSFLGIILIVKHFFENKKTTFCTFLRVTSLLSLTPLIIETTAQLRMYGLILFGASLQYLGLSSYLNSKSFKNLLYLLLLLVTVNLIDYPLLISGFFVILYASASTNIIIKKKLFLVFCAFCAISLGQVWQSFGTLHIKHQLEYSYSWINQPNLLQSIETILSTVSVTASLPIILITFFLFILASIKFLYTLKTRGFTFLITFYRKEMTALFIFPILCLLGISVLLPFLADRIYFHQFVPAVSLFLPRILLPFSLFFSIALAKQKNTLSIIISIILIFYYLYSNISTLNSLAKERSAISNEKIYLPNESVIFFPSWVALETIQSAQQINLKQLTQIMINSENIEQTFYKLAKNDQTDKLCQEVKEQVIIVKPIQNEYINQANMKFINTINKCCNNLKPSADYLYYFCNSKN